MDTKTPEFTIGEEDVVDPASLLLHAGTDIGMTVADMGVGREGNFMLTAGAMVGERGTVYAIDVVKSVLELMDNKASNANMNNIKTVWTDLEVYGAATAIPDGSVDIGILANTLFQSTNHEAMVKECTRMIKKGGKILMVDWKPVPTVLGPPVESRVGPDMMKPISEKLGLTMIDEFEAGEYHWAIIWQK